MATALDIGYNTFLLPLFSYVVTVISRLSFRGAYSPHFRFPILTSDD